MVARLREDTRRLALALGVRGLMNVQFAIKNDRIYVLEVNPRASRTVPFISKATGVPFARLAARAQLGEQLAALGFDPNPEPRGVCVKKPVYPFDRFPGEDTLLGPEMKSTGEVMGIDSDLGRAFAKALLADGGGLPRSGGAFLSVRDRDKRAIVFIAKRLADLGFELLATEGTGRLLRMNGLAVERVYKVREDGSPNAADLIRAGTVSLVINTPLGRPSRYDERAIRLAAVERGILTLTTVPGAAAAVSAIEAVIAGELGVSPLQEHLAPVPV
jgi:carbamoyl-phosphate synthase large subunit